MLRLKLIYIACSVKENAVICFSSESGIIAGSPFARVFR
jgi:hypothetical protein